MTHAADCGSVLPLIAYAIAFSVFVKDILLGSVFAVSIVGEVAEGDLDERQFDWTLHSRQLCAQMLDAVLSVVYQFLWISMRGAVSVGATRPESEPCLSGLVGSFR